MDDTEVGYVPGPRALFGQAELRRMMHPRSVAVVGASETPGSFGRRTIENLDIGFPGRILPVNPRYREMFGRPCYASLEDLPEPPDCVILTVPREHVEPLVERAAAIGAGGVMLYSSGYAEVGRPERVAAQRRLAEIAARTGLRILGPNCAGIANLTLPAGLTFMPKFFEMRRVCGPVGLVSQSGALGYVVLQAMERGIGFSHYLTAGNSCDVDVCDLVNYLVEEERTRVIACMLEGVRDGARLLGAAQAALRAGKPLVVYKLGGSEISRQTAMSHTGTLVGADAAYRAALRRAGAVIVDHWEEVLETATLFARAGVPRCPGVGVMAPSGGAAVMAADEAERVGLSLPPPQPQTSAKLEAVIPEFGSSANPSDITAESVKDVTMYGTCIRAFAEDPGYGAVVVPMMSVHLPGAVERAHYMAKLAPELPVPLCVVWLNEWLQGPGSEIYDGCENLPTFRTMARCITALARWNAYHAGRAELLRDDAPVAAPPGAAAVARAVLAAAPPGRTLGERLSKEVLAAYGIPVTREVLARDVEAAVAAAREIGFPVALKADSPDIPHKTEAGVIRLGIADEAALRAAHAAILAAAARVPGARVEGVLVQQMARPGAEMMVGARLDAQFGPLITCGFGGVAVEVTRDVATALAPVGAREAGAMIASLRGHRLLTGYRNLPAADTGALAEIVGRLSLLARDLADDIEEIDVNPVILGPGGALAVDALLVRRAAAGAP
jgi:acyl-CoA synthetase (NDP forming)